MDRYKREDGLDLTATLYLPPGYEASKDGRLPCILSAYPREFKSKVRSCDWLPSCLFPRTLCPFHTLACCHDTFSGKDCMRRIGISSALHR